MKYKEFNWFNWIADVSKWVSTIAVLIFVFRTGLENEAFNDVLTKTIVGVGFILYIITSGIRLLNRTSPTYWIYHGNTVEEASDDK